MAAALVALGLDAGSAEDLIPSDQANPEGYFESVGAFALNSRIVNHLEGWWDAPPSLVDGWQDAPVMDRWVREAAALRAEMLPGERWLLKDPRVSLILPL